MVPDDAPRSPDERPPRAPGSILPDDHWSLTRNERNHEALEYLREKSHAPGVASGGAERNQYCMECGGVLPLAYISSKPADRGRIELCPHCGAKVSQNVRTMFNWVEMDQVPDGDLRALLPWIAGLAAAIGLIVWLVFR